MKEGIRIPRPRRFRKVGFFPNFNLFKPAGRRAAELEEVSVTVDEFETVRLKDFLGMEQKKACAKMDISQPTFHRLLLDARKKISEALVEGKAIRIEGGNFNLVKETIKESSHEKRCRCMACNKEVKSRRGVPCIKLKCPDCGGKMVRII